jgi:hypothetical protein
MGCELESGCNNIEHVNEIVVDVRVAIDRYDVGFDIAFD